MKISIDLKNFNLTKKVFFNLINKFPSSIKQIIKYFYYLVKFPKRMFLSVVIFPYLEKTGWYKSIEQHKSIDNDSNCIPWYTYSSIYFLNKRIKAGMKIFEFGSGNSTLWYAMKGCDVTSYENDINWFNSLKSTLPSNVDYHYCPLEYGGDYSKSVASSGCVFDIIVIDGRDRVNCAFNSINYLSNKGVIIWDNSDRESYKEGYVFLKKNGFKRLEFQGHGPICNYYWETSIFYKENNCLEI